MPTRIFITGHRPNKIGGYDPNHPLRVAITDEIRAKLISARNKFGDIHINNGGALGVDQDAALECIYLTIPFTLYAPCHGQENKWPRESQEQYYFIRDQASEIIYTHEGPYPGPWCLQKRNEDMIDNADLGLAVWNGDTSGGTYSAVAYALQKGVKVVRIDPTKLLA